jgi:hypothetical protein
METPPFAHAESHTAAAPSARGARTLARRLLLDAVVIGGLADALLRNGLGLGFFMWLVAVAVTFAHFVLRRGNRLTREQGAWLTAALFFGGAFVWRDSDSLLFYDFLAIFVAAALLAATSSRASPMRSILGQRVRDLAQAVGRTIQNGVVAIFYAVQASAVGEGVHSWREGRARTVLRATLLALPLVLVFGALFSAADPVFGSLFALPKLDLGNIMSHLVITVIAAWIVGGWLYGALLDDRSVRRVRDGMPITLGSLDVTIVLGCLVGLFGLFVGVQLGWLFGGERLVQSTTGLSYAQYARRGFFELVMVTVLVLPVLLGTRAAIQEDDAAAIRRHRVLAMPLLVLIGGVMASALGRMALYVHYYGLSTDRLFASVFMGWLAVVFAWYGLTVLRGRAHDFAAGMTITGFATLAILNLVNPEALVARANIIRGATAMQIADSVDAGSRSAVPVDLFYLTYRLSGDAADHVVDALVAQPISPSGSASRIEEVKARCDAVRGLFRRWGTGPVDSEAWRQASDWRRWNVGAWRASTAVRANEHALRAVTCWDASGEAAFGDREARASRPGEQWYLKSKADSASH